MGSNGVLSVPDIVHYDDGGSRHQYAPNVGCPQLTDAGTSRGSWGSVVLN